MSQGRVYIYYALTNFYQNHRRYVRSRDDRQLLGHNLGDVSKDCEPFRTGIVTMSENNWLLLVVAFINITAIDYVINIVKENGKEKFILPCGAIANSMFSDEIELWHNGARVGVEQKGIAWESDKNYKFRNPSWYKDAKDNCNHEMWKKYAKPPGNFSSSFTRSVYQKLVSKTLALNVHIFSMGETIVWTEGWTWKWGFYWLDAYGRITKISEIISNREKSWWFSRWELLITY